MPPAPRASTAAAGHVDLAARAALALAGPGLGLVLMPPRRVRDLAAGLDDLTGVHFDYRRDIHHEAPVVDPGPRELISYTVRFGEGRARCEAALPGAPIHVHGRRRYGAFFLDDAHRRVRARVVRQGTGLGERLTRSPALVDVHTAVLGDGDIVRWMYARSA